MMIFFITGGLGFLGQYVVEAVHRHDPEAEIRVLVRTQRKTLLGVESLERVRLIRGTLDQPESFAAELQGVDTIIHNAAVVSFRKSDADEIYQSNVVGTRNLAQAALEAGCRNFIFLSSVSAVGFDPPQVSTEDMYPDVEYKRTHDMYGYSKLVSEKELRELSEKMRIVILNPSVVLGPGSDRIRAVFRMARFLPVLPMLSYVNSFVDVRDVAAAVLLALTRGRNGERYIVSAHSAGMLTFTKLTLEAMGKRPLLIPVSGAGVRLMDAILWILDLLKLNPGIRKPSQMAVDKKFSSEKIRCEMGWEPGYSLDKSIVDSVHGSQQEV